MMRCKSLRFRKMKLEQRLLKIISAELKNSGKISKVNKKPSPKPILPVVIRGSLI